jgi:hypothetical protein
MLGERADASGLSKKTQQRGDLWLTLLLIRDHQTNPSLSPSAMKWNLPPKL